MAAYKVGKALDSLRNEFGQNQQIYPVTNSSGVAYAPALEILGQLFDQGQKQVDESNQRLAVNSGYYVVKGGTVVMARRKQPSSQQRKKKRA
jgi:hypothetical protein